MNPPESGARGIVKWAYWINRNKFGGRVQTCRVCGHFAKQSPSGKDVLRMPGCNVFAFSGAGMLVQDLQMWGLGRRGVEAQGS